MSLADPLSITISGATTSLPRVSVGEDKSEYQSSDGLIHLLASHQESGKNRRVRRMLRIDTSKMAPDPFRPAENTLVSMSYYIVVDAPLSGFTAVEQLAVMTGFTALTTASSNLVLTKLLGGES